MAKEATITLDGVSYVVPALNIGQLEDLTVAFDGAKARIPFEILRIALARVEPQVDLRNLTPTMDEVGTAVQAILETAGLQKNQGNPPTPLLVVKND